MEEICSVKVFGNGGAKEVKVAHLNSIEKQIIESSNFVFAENERQLGDPKTIISFMNSVGDDVVCFWKLSEDNIYRVVIDICVSKESEFAITRRIPDKPARRVDLKIVY
jgi:hypothetical protein